MRNLFVRDEREAAVEQGGDRLAYLVVFGGIVSVGYRLSRRALSRNALVLVGLTIAVAVVVGALVALGVRA